MSKTRKVICYTGGHSKKRGVHTPKEFLKVARHISKSKIYCTHSKTRKYICPAKDDLKGWMRWTRAKYMDEEECKKAAKNVEKILKRHNATFKAMNNSSKPVEKCISQKCSTPMKLFKAEDSMLGAIYKKKCYTLKSINSRLNCIKKTRNASNYKKLSNNAQSCMRKECAKEVKKFEQKTGLKA